MDIMNNHIIQMQYNTLPQIEALFHRAEDDRDSALDALWESTLYVISSAVVFKTKLQNHPATQPKRYFVHFRGYNEKLAVKMARYVNTAALCYRHFNTIWQNVSGCDYLDYRVLTIYQLYDCRLRTNSAKLDAAARPECLSQRNQGAVNVYAEADFADLCVIVHNHPCAQSTDTKENAADMLQRLSTYVVSRRM